MVSLSLPTAAAASSTIDLEGIYVYNFEDGGGFYAEIVHDFPTSLGDWDRDPGPDPGPLTISGVPTSNQVPLWFTLGAPGTNSNIISFYISGTNELSGFGPLTGFFVWDNVRYNVNLTYDADAGRG